jgi:hypothetical protein
MQTGFQLALELSNVFPIHDAVRAVGHHILQLARDLRKSGSDLVVEADLAEVFGRGRISSELETKFKEATKITTITPLSDGSEVVLASGPGPTLQNAFRDRKYLASVVQLSFLTWMHPRESLATMLSMAITKRYEMGVHDASPDPGYEGIMKTLMACSSQTSSFNWSVYVEMVQDKLQEAMPDYAFSPDYLRLSPSTLLGAIDYLYLVQSLPEDRKITVSTENGAITLIIWAHFILDLTVAITTSSGEAIVFGNRKDPHMTISWSRETKEDADELSWPVETDDEEPTIRLLDPNLSIILESSPDPDRKGFLSEAEERHPVTNYGATYLRRLFNRNMITNDADPIFEESVKLITALAIHTNDRIDRDPGIENIDSQSAHYPQQRQKFWGEVWRILQSSRMLFASIPIDTSAVESYVKFLSLNRLDENSCPNTFKAFLIRIGKGTDTWSFTIAVDQLFEQVKFLAEIVLVFAHVANMESCGTMPIILGDNHPLIPNVMSSICRDLNERPTVKSFALFHAVARLLTQTELQERDDDPKFSSRTDYFLSLCSDFGWSVFLSTVGDKDPASCRPELIHVRQGSPMNSLSGERKSRIRDGAGFWVQKDYPEPSDILIRGPEYLPRLSAKVLTRKEYWSSRTLEFESTLYFNISPSPEWRHQMSEDTPTFDQFTGYRNMHDTLWYTFITPACGHPVESHVEQPIPLGPDAAVLLGWRKNFETYRVGCPERILILLTRSDPRIRWLAIASNMRSFSNETSSRSLMLRAPNCCDSCALAYVAGISGRWALIL